MPVSAHGTANRDSVPIVLGADLPLVLIRPMQRVIWAKKLVKKHLGLVAVASDKPPRQGLFSSTLFVRLEDGRNVVVQFRTEPLSVDSFMLAREVLGDVVPDVVELPDEELLEEGIWAYCYNRLPGKMWAYSSAGRTDHGRVTVNAALGSIFSKGYVADDSAYAVEDTLRPRIQTIIESPTTEIDPYREMLRRFLDGLKDFCALPLWVAHHGLNEISVLIDEQCHITGLVGWNLSSPLPFGIGFGCIHKITGDGIGVETAASEEAERAFWKALFEGMDVTTRSALEKHIQLVQDAVILGTLLDCFRVEGEAVVVDNVHLNALPKLLSYRIPLIRGDGPLYEAPGS